MFDTLFGLGNMTALAGWSLLALLPRWRGLAQAVAGLAIPALLALAYTVLVGVWWSRAEGGFGSIEQVRALFGSTPVLVAGWFHYLAFDLFVGAWISREAQREGIAHLLVVPLLVLTFLFGPIGYLGFVALRATRRCTWMNKASAGLARHWSGFAAREPVLVTSGLLFLAAMVPTGLA